MTEFEVTGREALIAAARAAAVLAYAPYSMFSVGAALLFADGGIVTGANVENASYGLSLCAEAVAVAVAMAAGRRGGLVGIAVVGGAVVGGGVGGGAAPVTPCGRCRQVLSELAGLGSSDPVVWCVGAGDRGSEVLELRLSALLPHSFGPGHLSPS